MKFNVGYFSKAIYAAATSFVASLAVVVSGSETLGQVTFAQWLVAVGAALAAGGAVYGVTNAVKALKS